MPKHLEVVADKRFDREVERCARRTPRVHQTVDALTWLLARKPHHGWLAEDGSPLRAIPVYPNKRQHLVFYVVENDAEQVILRSIIPVDD